MSTKPPTESPDPLDGALRTAFPRPASEPSLQPGSRVGDFELVAHLGQGSMGVVWQAVELSLGRRAVALKFVLPGRLDRKHREFFAREARAAARLSHSSIVAVHSFGSDAGLDWMAMELVLGARTLRTYLDEQKAAEEIAEGHPAAAARLVLAMAEAMQVAHDAGVIHRDLKPQNILLTVDGRPKVTDFGLARILDEPSLSKSGEFAGTYFYASPEQVHASRHGIDHRTDIFSLGVVLYEILTLQRPFQGDTSQQVAAQILLKDPPDPRSLRSRTPRDLAVITAKCLEKDRERRFGSMAELADEFRRYLSGVPIRSRAPSTLRRTWSWIRHHQLATTASVFVAVLIAGIAFSGDEFVQAIETRRVEELEEAVDRGFDHLGVELFDQAELAFHEALEIDSQSLEAHAGLALALVRARKNAEAVNQLDQRPRILERHQGLRMLREYAASSSSRHALELEPVTYSSQDPVDLFLEAEMLSTFPEALAMASLERTSQAYRKAILHSKRARALYYQAFIRSFEVEQARRRSFGEEQQFPEALEVAEAMLAIWPDDPDARLHSALARQLAGQTEVAVQEFEALQSTLGDDPVYWSRRASCLREAKKPDEALLAAARSAELSPRSAQAHATLGACLADLGRTEEALETYERVLELDSQLTEAYFRGAILLDGMDLEEEAIDWLRRGIESESKLFRLQYNLGGLLLGDKLHSEAELAFRMATEADPEVPEAHCNLAISLAGLGRFEEALAEFRLCNQYSKARSSWSYPSLEWQRGAEAVVGWKGVVDEAMKGKVPTITLSSLSIELIEAMHFLEKHGHLTAKARVESSLRSALRIDARDTQRFWLEAASNDPERTEVWHNLGYVYLNSGRPEEAERAERKAIELAHGVGEMAWANLSAALIRLGRFDEALSALETAASLDASGLFSSFIDRWHADYVELVHVAERLQADPASIPVTGDQRSNLLAAIASHGLGLHAEAVPFYLALFSDDPRLADGEELGSDLNGPLDPGSHHRVEAIACALEATRAAANPVQGEAFLQIAMTWWKAELGTLDRHAERGLIDPQRLRWRYSTLYLDPRFEVLRKSSDPELARRWQLVMAVLE